MIGRDQLKRNLENEFEQLAAAENTVLRDSGLSQDGLSLSAPSVTKPVVPAPLLPAPTQPPIVPVPVVPALDVPTPVSVPTRVAQYYQPQQTPPLTSRGITSSSQSSPLLCSYTRQRPQVCSGRGVVSTPTVCSRGGVKPGPCWVVSCLHLS